MNNDTHLSLKAAAQFLRRSPDLLRYRRLHGLPPPSIKLENGRVLYKVGDLRAFIEKKAAPK